MYEQFKKEVAEGFSKSPKSLSSKWFYDEIGDDLFVQIMQMPEYYLTKAEFEIFKNKSKELIASFGVQKDVPFELIELGAGDGTKTKELLKVLLNENYQFEYFPIDISQNALDGLVESLKRELPTLKVNALQGDYFEVLTKLSQGKKQKVVLFLGSNIGNMMDDRSSLFLSKLGEALNTNDKLMLGVDLIKPVDVVLPAYNDKAGITKRFNLNLLTRMNTELDANFDLNSFVHAPEYTLEEGIAKSFLMSSKNQTVTIGALNQTFKFSEGEKIHTEISRKYNDEILDQITRDTKFSIKTNIRDSKNQFADYILERA